MQQCPNCHKTVPYQAQYCAYCGAAIRTPAPHSGASMLKIVFWLCIGLLTLSAVSLFVVGVIANVSCPFLPTPVVTLSLTAKPIPTAYPQPASTWTPIPTLSLELAPSATITDQQKAATPTRRPVFVVPTSYPTLIPTLESTIAGEDSLEDTAKSVKTNVPGCTSGQVEITLPASGSTISGVVFVYGTVICNEFRYYKFEFEDPRCDRGICFVAGPPPQCNDTTVICSAEFGFTRPVINGLLMRWDTTTIPNGTYILRLVAVGAQGRVLNKIARIQITIQN